MRIHFPERVAASLATMLVVACGSDLALPTADPIDVDVPGAVQFVGPGAALHTQTCETATFDVEGYAHGDPISTISLGLAGGFDVTVSSTPGGAQSASPVVAYDSDILHADGNVDLQNPGLCTGCSGFLMVFPFINFPNVGDSPDGGTVTMTGFPAAGETTVKSYVAHDQETGEAINLLIDGVQTGTTVTGADGNTQSVDATEIAIATEVEFVYTGSGAVDNIEFCYRPPDDPPTNPGTGTPGYWKNHSEAWPVASIEIGGVMYTVDNAIAWMETPVRGDKTINMFAQLVAAKLNVLIGNDSSCIDDTIALADAWMASNPVGSGVRANSADWQGGAGGWHGMLTDYNEGNLCAPARD